MPKFLTLLSEEEYKMLLRHFCEQEKKRHVYYFDTSDLLLKHKGYSIKVDHATESSEYTLKVKRHGEQENILLEHLNEEEFQSLRQTSTLFSEPFTNFLEEHSDKRLIKLGALVVTGVTKEEPRVGGFWTVHKNLYPSGNEELVFGLSYQTQTHEIAPSLFNEALQVFEITKQPVPESRRDLFLR